MALRCWPIPIGWLRKATSPTRRNKRSPCKRRMLAQKCLSFRAREPQRLSRETCGGSVGFYPPKERWPRTSRLARGHDFSRRPVSRILSRTAIPLGGALLRALLSDLPAGLARRAGAPPRLAPRHSRLFGLAPCGVYPAMRLTTHAVRSYRTVSPLPRFCKQGGLFSVALAVPEP